MAADLDLNALREAVHSRQIHALDDDNVQWAGWTFILSQIDRVEGCEGCGGDGSHCGHKDCTQTCDYCTNLRADLAKLAAEVL